MSITPQQAIDLDELLKFLKNHPEYKEEWRIKRALSYNAPIHHGFGPVESDFDWLINYLISRNLIEKNSGIINLTKDGYVFDGFNNEMDQKMKNIQNEELDAKTKELNLTNLKLNQELLENQKELDKLKIENLKLQNKKLRNYILYSVISFFAGVFTSQLDFIKELFEGIFKNN